MWRNLKSNRSRRGPRDEQGVVLLLVVLILALISVMVLSWAQEWRTELLLAANFREATQCRRLAEGGVYYALGKLMETKILEIQPEHPERFQRGGGQSGGRLAGEPGVPRDQIARGHGAGAGGR